MLVHHALLELKRPYRRGRKCAIAAVTVMNVRRGEHLSCPSSLMISLCTFQIRLSFHTHLPLPGATVATEYFTSLRISRRRPGVLPGYVDNPLPLCLQERKGKVHSRSPTVGVLVCRRVHAFEYRGNRAPGLESFALFRPGAITLQLRHKKVQRIFISSRPAQRSACSWVHPIPPKTSEGGGIGISQ